jgi:catabolite regulation protein CreA
MASVFEATAGKLLGPVTGGTVTQADTSGKATGVTLNAASGQITMDGAELAAGVEVSFTVTNSLVAATDVVVVNHGSAGTAGAYLVQANTLAAGSFKITVSNVSAGALSEAIVLNFVALKGASS